MIRKEGTEIILSSQEKSEFAQILDKLEGEAKSLFYLVVFFYPNIAYVAQSTALLEGSVSLLVNGLEKAVAEINTTLTEIDSPYKVLGGKTAIQLKRGEEREFNFKSWVAFSNKERVLLLELLKGKDMLTKTTVAVLNEKLLLLGIGSISKDKKGRYHVVATSPFTTPFLLQSLEQYVQFERQLVQDISKI